MGVIWGPPLSAAAPGPLPQQPHRSPLLGISAIKAVGVASSPELGPPLPRSPRGGHCLAWSGVRAARGAASSFQRAAGGAGRGSPAGACCRQWGPEVPAPVPAQAGGSTPSDPRPQSPRPPASGFVMEPPRSSSPRRLCFSSVQCAPPPTRLLCDFVSRLSGVGNLLVFFQPSWPYLFRFSQCLQPVR